ncbi:hypothetical protein L209DRAFT_561837 [Thermothelomyces heterothallicus CBS 203.75]
MPATNNRLTQAGVVVVAERASASLESPCSGASPRAHGPVTRRTPGGRIDEHKTCPLLLRHDLPSRQVVRFQVQEVMQWPEQEGWLAEPCSRTTRTKDEIGECLGLHVTDGRAVLTDLYLD